MPWVLILAIVLAIALFAIFIVACVCWRRKKKHKTQRKPASESLPQPPPSELQVFSGADAVFEEQPATDSNHLNVFQHLARVSEHLYDSISATGLRLFSRSSVGSHSHNDGELSARNRHSTENEYVDEGETSVRSIDFNSDIIWPACLVNFRKQELARLGPREGRVKITRLSY